MATNNFIYGALPLLALPVEIQQKILGYLSLPDLVSARNVCSQLRTVVTSFTTNHCIIPARRKLLAQWLQLTQFPFPKTVSSGKYIKTIKVDGNADAEATILDSDISSADLEGEIISADTVAKKQPINAKLPNMFAFFTDMCHRKNHSNLFSGLEFFAHEWPIKQALWPLGFAISMSLLDMKGKIYAPADCIDEGWQDRLMFRIYVENFEYYTFFSRPVPDENGGSGGNGGSDPSSHSDDNDHNDYSDDEDDSNSGGEGHSNHGKSVGDAEQDKTPNGFYKYDLETKEYCSDRSPWSEIWDTALEQAIVQLGEADAATNRSSTSQKLHEDSENV